MNALEGEDTQVVVYVLDDDDAMRDSIALTLESESYVVETFGSPESFLAHYAGGVGCLILDLMMPGMTGLELYRELQQRNLLMPFLMVTGNGTVPDAVEALKFGAIDFLEKPFRSQALIDSVDKAVVLAQSVHKFTKLLQKLSPREKEFYDLLVRGKSVKEASADLHISGKTGQIHRGKILQKMEVANVVELCADAMRNQNLRFGF